MSCKLIRRVILTHIRYFCSLALTTALFSYCRALSFEWNIEGQRYDSNSLENFEKFYQKFLSVPVNREVVEAMKRLPIGHMGAVIDSYWTIGVRPCMGCNERSYHQSRLP